jgi:flavin reductase
MVWKEIQTCQIRKASDWKPPTSQLINSAFDAQRWRSAPASTIFKSCDIPSLWRTTMQSSIEFDFRQAMRRLAATVSVVTCTDAEGGWYGIAATSVTSVSMSPATLLICVNQSASLHTPLSNSERFCVNVLMQSQVEVANAFGGKLKGRERFSVGSWHLMGGQPALVDAQANMLCTISSRITHGSHSIFLGQIEALRVEDVVSPLVYHDGGYSAASRLEQHA